jgi:uncharacterized iron-regulated protein
MNGDTASPSGRRRIVGLAALGLALAAPSATGAEAQAPDSAMAPSAHGAAAHDPHVLDVQEGVDFRVYDVAGAPSSLDAILDAATAGEVLLIGEAHDDMVGHAVELRLLGGAFGRLASGGAERGRPLILSLEMFERDVQYVLDEYLDGLVSEEHLVAGARPWGNYVVAYRPMVEFAKAHELRVVAANAPRRYASRVTAEGPEALLALSPLARSFLPPLPYPGPSEPYRAEWHRLMTSDTTESHGHAVSENAIQAQALWDAAMAHAISGALVRDIGALVVHVAGAFHVARGTGIPERIADYRPGTRLTTVVMTEAEDIDAWTESEHGGLADFVVLTATKARR